MDELSEVAIAGMGKKLTGMTTMKNSVTWVTMMTLEKVVCFCGKLAGIAMRKWKTCLILVQILEMEVPI